MTIQTRLAEELEESDRAPSVSDQEPAAHSANSPFLLEYDFEDWELDGQTADMAVGLVIAATNLL